MLDLQRNWPGTILLGGVVVFYTYVIIKGRQQEKKDKEGQRDMRGDADQSKWRRDDG
jgi:hypothetical protein